MDTQSQVRVSIVEILYLVNGSTIGHDCRATQDPLLMQHLDLGIDLTVETQIISIGYDQKLTHDPA